MVFDFFGHPMFASITGPECDVPAEVVELERDMESMALMQARGDSGIQEGQEGSGAGQAAEGGQVVDGGVVE